MKDSYEEEKLIDQVSRLFDSHMLHEDKAAREIFLTYLSDYKMKELKGGFYKHLDGSVVCRICQKTFSEGCRCYENQGGLKCISCDDEARYIFKGDSFCEKHL